MQQPTIRLLIINDSSSEAERLISMLQNAGRSVRATHVESQEALNKLLQEKLWDLLIAIDSTTNLPPIDALKLIRRLNKDVPVVLLTDKGGSQPNVEGIKVGAQDVVKLDEDQHLLLVIDRELRNRQERENRRAAERRFNDIALRNQKLLDSSRDAIAFVQDGMFLYANESFAELLQYDDREDLECMPVIDIVKSTGHEKLKSFLKNFTLKVDDTESKNIKLPLVDAHNHGSIVSFEVRKAIYDDESCIQFVHHAKGADTQELEAQIAEIRVQDSLTGLYNKGFLLEKLNSLIKKATAREFNSVLFHIGIEHFSETVSEKLGVGSIDQTLASIAKFTQSQVKKTDFLCRYADDSFILIIPKINAIKAQERAKELLKSLRDHIVDVEGKTLHFNYHIGISVINETSSNIDAPIDQSIQALEQARKSDDNSLESGAQLYEASANEEEQTEKDILTTIQRALDESRFKLLFQPILSLRGSDREHYEVLLRMIDGDEDVSPNDFLEEAAKIGATKRIDRWVILEATKTLSQHRKNGHDTILVVHLSKDSMLDDSLASWLKVVFKTAQLPTSAVIFQINEVDVNDHLNNAKAFTEALSELGCGVSINHFGCVLKPFKVLSEITTTHVKIDGSFTQDLQSNEEGVKSLNELVSELHQNDKITIVPFVESANLLSKLWQSGVHYIQGYYLQGPTAEMDYDFDMES